MSPSVLTSDIVQPKVICSSMVLDPMKEKEETDEWDS